MRSANLLLDTLQDMYLIVCSMYSRYAHTPIDPPHWLRLPFEEMLKMQLNFHSKLSQSPIQQATMCPQLCVHYPILVSTFHLTKWHIHKYKWIEWDFGFILIFFKINIKVPCCSKAPLKTKLFCQYFIWYYCQIEEM